MLDEPLRGNRHFAPALNFLIGFHDIQRSDGAGLGAAFDLFEPILRNADGAALDFENFTAATQSQNCVAAARNRSCLVWAIRTSARGSASSDRCSSAFSGFTISPHNKRKESAEEDLLSIVIEAEIGNSRIADRLADASTVAEA